MVQGYDRSYLINMFSEACWFSIPTKFKTLQKAKRSRRCCVFVLLVLQRGNHQHQFTAAIALILFKPSNVLEIQTHPYRFRKPLQKNIYIFRVNA